ncbi:SLATT domain-containing protein [Rhizocola hellebori]|nr:SLATT domain-containing protein [Rhizocola hellebori]
MRDQEPPIQSARPSPGLAPLDLAQDLVARIERGNDYARSRKVRFRRSSALIRLLSMALLVSSTIILGLQDLQLWAALGFALVAVVTVVNTLEAFFAWRSRWILMEETQYRFYRLRDEVTFYIASTPVDQLDAERIKALFGDYQQIWDQLGARWLEFRQSAGSIQ